MALLPMPPIPQAVRDAFQQQWADFSDAQDPVQLPPADSSEYNLQQVFVLGSGEILGPDGLQKARAAGWRFLAHGVKSPHGIAASVAQRKDGWSLESVSYGPGIDEALKAVLELQPLLQALANTYELRLLKIPSLLTETFWLHSTMNDQHDIVVPYLTRLPGIERTHKYSENEFLFLVRPFAKKRLEYAKSSDAQQDISPDPPSGR